MLGWYNVSGHTFISSSQYWEVPCEMTARIRRGNKTLGRDCTVLYCTVLTVSYTVSRDQCSVVNVPLSQVWGTNVLSKRMTIKKIKMFMWAIFFIWECNNMHQIILGVLICNISWCRMLSQSYIIPLIYCHSKDGISRLAVITIIIGLTGVTQVIYFPMIWE